MELVLNLNTWINGDPAGFLCLQVPTEIYVNSLLCQYEGLILVLSFYGIFIALFLSRVEINRC